MAFYLFKLKPAAVATSFKQLAVMSFQNFELFFPAIYRNP